MSTASLIRKSASQPRGSVRRGAVAPLVALLLVPFLGLVAFAVDIARMVQARSDLQNAADAAALAGAGQLMNGFVQYSLPGQTNKSGILSAAEASATTYATNFSSYNAADGYSSLTLNSSDVQFGFTDASNNYTSAPTYTGYPNTVKVTMRLDGSANGALTLFFARIFGTNTANLTTTAAATIFSGTVTSFKSSSVDAGLLPMTMDVNAWNTFISSGVSSDGTTHSSVNGAPQMQVYPSPNLAPGNFGMLSLNDSANSSSAISGWISNGLSASDLANLQSNGLLPLPNPNPGLWDWKGLPGFKSSDLNSLPVGQTFLLPLFEPVVPELGSSYAAYQATDKTDGTATPGQGGVGQNAYYNIVGFVGVEITQLDKSSDAYIQPAAVVPPTAIFDPTTVAPAGTTSSLVTTFTTPKLTQ